MTVTPSPVTGPQLGSPETPKKVLTKSVPYLSGKIQKDYDIQSIIRRRKVRFKSTFPGYTIKGKRYDTLIVEYQCYLILSHLFGDLRTQDRY